MNKIELNHFGIIVFYWVFPFFFVSFENEKFFYDDQLIEDYQNAKNWYKLNSPILSMFFYPELTFFNFFWCDDRID